MDRRELEEIDRFLASVGQGSLLTYYGLQDGALASDVEAFVKKRRAWAQGQQSNPKYKVEALFLIKQNALIRKALIEEPEAYRTHLKSTHAQRNVESLRVFIRGTISSGTFTAAAEAAIRKQGRELELPDGLVTQQIEEALAAAGVKRAGDAEPTPAPSTIDFYEVLQVDPFCTIDRLEQAYRARYRWARNLNDLALSADMLSKLDQAWNVLRDPDRRARYDSRRAVWTRATESRPNGILGLLPGTAEPTADTESSDDMVSQTPVYQPTSRTSQVSAPRPLARTQPPTRMPPMPPPSMRVVLDELEITNAGLKIPPMPAPPPPRLGPAAPASAEPDAARLRGPKLGVDGPDTVVVKAKEAKVRHRLLIRNQGEGKMPGRVVADHEWLEIAKPQLDPKLATQVVEVIIHADRMPWRSASATLTVVTDHGERKTIAFQVSRRSSLPWALVVGLLGILAVAAAVGIAFVVSGQAHDAVLKLTIDPPADHVYVNGTAVGDGATVEYRSTNVDAPVRLRVEAQGFAPHDELVQLEAGKSLDRKIRLDLSDAVDWVPPPGSKGAPVEDGGAPIVQARSAELAACIVTGPPVDAHFRAIVDPSGLVRTVQIIAPAGASVETTQCVKRTFRTMRFGPVTADYGEVDAVAHLAATGP